VRVLWVGDAVAKTGFAKVTHAMVPRLIAAGWDVHVLGSNYPGDPHPFPYPIWPARSGGDAWGVGRVEALAKKLQPDVVVVQGDPWNVREFLIPLHGLCPVVGYMPLDSQNVPACRDLNGRPGKEGYDGLAHAVWYTEFARAEAHTEWSGYTGSSAVVGLGIDASQFRARPRAEALAKLGLTSLPAHAFIVGNVNRNMARKRLDLTIFAFARWWEQAGKPAHAYLYLHASQLDTGPNLLQLAKRVGLTGRVIITNKTMRPGEGIPELDMTAVYSLFDVQVSTTQGEGWGLTTMEGMACGVPQIVPAYSALAEWPTGAVQHVEAAIPTVTVRGVNTIGMAPDVADVADALQAFYADPGLRLAYGRLGRGRVTEARFDWDGLGRALAAELQGVVTRGPRADPPAATVPADAEAERAPDPEVPIAPPQAVRSKTGLVELARSR